MFSSDQTGEGPDSELTETEELQAFVQEVTVTLVHGKRHQTAGLGTFSTCTRKATAERAACKMAMFRASAELRAYASGGPAPSISGPHASVVSALVQAMLSEEGITVPLLGRLAVVPNPGKKPRLIFHGAKELNDVLTAG
jgi:nucleoid DNA-binding protein